MAEPDPVSTEKGTDCGRIEAYCLAALVMVAPLLVVWLAREIFNNIIEVGRIDMGFLPGADFGQPYPLPLIATSVVSSLYNFGFALCAVLVFAVALTFYASVIVWTAVRRTPIRIAFFVILAGVFSLLAVDFSKMRVSDRIPVPIAQQLIDGTLDYLPTCDAADPSGLHTCSWKGIGNTGNSLQRIVTAAMGMVLVAALSYLISLAVVTGSSELDMESRSSRVQNITLLAAMTFLFTIVAVHLLFQPGADLIAEVYGTQASGLPKLQNYANLRSAMTLYWATIFSLALGTGYFAAVAAIQRQQMKMVDFGGVWNIVKALLAVLSPVIADWVLKLGEAFSGAAGTQ